MTLDDLKEQISTQAKQLWERLQESSFYGQLRDRYDNLSATMQKLTLAGIVVLVVAVVFSFPYSNFSQSQDHVNEFENKRALIRELLKVSKEASEVPQIPVPPPVDSLKGMIDTHIKNANLTPEQIKSVEASSADSKIIPANLSSGAVVIRLAKLNLRQIIDLGYQFQSISPSVKLQDLNVQANREDLRYFDVVYKLIALAVPSTPPPEPPEEPKAGKGKSRAKGSRE